MSERILYLDPWSGVSGDMLLAALIDTDGPKGRLEAELRRTVAALGLDESLVEVRRGVEWGIACTRVEVKDRGTQRFHGLAEMENAIAGALLSPRVQGAAIGAVRRLAEVEAAIHGCSVDEVHFHEVGAVDTLVDVVGVFALVEALRIDRVAVGTIPVGGGTVEIGHGRMGVPAPATAALLQDYEIVGGPEPRELTTPTGALLVAQLGAEQSGLPQMRPENTGHGAGSMKLDRGPNLLRVMIGTATGDTGWAETDRDEVVELQTNLDDVSAEVIGHTVRLLREAGALDVWTAPAYMKKDRPGVIVHVLIAPSRETEATTLLFEQTGTLGVRRQAVSRHVATRDTVVVTVEGTEVKVKCGRWQGGLTSVSPEYEDAAAVAAGTGLPLQEVMRLARQEALEILRLRGEHGE